jgi:hypothetical protein
MDVSFSSTAMAHVFIFRIAIVCLQGSSDIMLIVFDGCDPDNFMANRYRTHDPKAYEGGKTMHVMFYEGHYDVFIPRKKGLPY